MTHISDFKMGEIQDSDFKMGDIQDSNFAPYFNASVTGPREGEILRFIFGTWNFLGFKFQSYFLGFKFERGRDSGFKFQIGGIQDSDLGLQGPNNHATLQWSVCSMQRGCTVDTMGTIWGSTAL